VIDPGLDGRVALVTGANHGIGAAAAHALAAQGVGVFVTYLLDYLRTRDDDPGTPPEFHELRSVPGTHVADVLRSSGGRASSAEVDLADPEVIPGLFDVAERDLGPVEILVLNAAASEVDTFRDAAEDRFGRRHQRVSAATHDYHFAVNSRTNALLIAEFARRHRERNATWGRIVGVTSSGIDGFPDEISYGASKAALESYVKSAAWELGSLGITANLVCPPGTDTGWMTDSVKESVLRESPLQHVAVPREIADVIVFLASEQARWITGQRIRIA
jgi:3-oxoacyl-[acyl-carrier protein] reductase